MKSEKSGYTTKSFSMAKNNNKDYVCDEIQLIDDWKVGNYFSLKHKHKHCIVEAHFSSFEEIKTRTHDKNRSISASNAQTMRQTAKFEMSHNIVSFDMNQTNRNKEEEIKFEYQENNQEAGLWSIDEKSKSDVVGKFKA